MIQPSAASTPSASLTAPAIKNLINGIRAQSQAGNHAKSGEFTAEALRSLVNFLVSAAPQINAAGGGSAASNSLYYDGGSGTSFSPNFANGITQVFTLTGNGTIGAAIGLIAGQEMTLVLVQDGTGGWQVTSWDASYLFPGTFGLDPTIATATVFKFECNAAGHLFLTSTPVTQIPWP